MLTRRDLIKAVAAGSVGWSAGCTDVKRLAGGFVGPSVDVGHRLRDGVRLVPTGGEWQEVDVAIVGSGIAGLSSARRLMQAGIDRILVLELEQMAGGTSQGGESAVTRYPWGAHYVPVPLPENRPLIALLNEMGVLERIDPDGRPIVAEQYLCREPEERLYANGRWHEGLLPHDLTTDQVHAELAAFEAEIDRWVAWRDALGRPAFTIPIAGSSDDPACTALDQISFEDWVSQRAFRSERLRWMLDYACRDDFGCTPAQTSAWAGLFYFASRQRAPGEQSQPLITWPEGNARVVRDLAAPLAERLRTGVAVTEIRGVDDANDRVRVIGFDTSSQRVVAVRARRAVVAAPQFVVPYLVPELPAARVQAARQFDYAPWLVANLHLRDRPQSVGVSLAWDSVFLDSASLG
jgi:phytoene dehydrogenase-like protein